MWLKQSISKLVRVINFEDKEKAESFVEHFFEFLESQYCQIDSILEFKLGIQQKMYLKFLNADDDSVSLENFARYLLGLCLIYLKLSTDGYSNENMVSLFSSRSLADALQFGSTVKDYIEEFNYQHLNLKKPKRLVPHLSPVYTSCPKNSLFYTTHPEQYLKFKAVTWVLKNLEGNVLADLKYDIILDWEYLTTLFSQPELSECCGLLHKELSQIQSDNISNDFKQFQKDIQIYSYVYYDTDLTRKSTPFNSIAHLNSNYLEGTASFLSKESTGLNKAYAQTDWVNDEEIEYECMPKLGDSPSASSPSSQYRGNILGS